MEKRFYKMNVFRAGGNASKEAKAFKTSIPSKWAYDMGFTAEDRTVELEYDSQKKEITIRKIAEEDIPQDKEMR